VVVGHENPKYPTYNLSEEKKNKMKGKTKMPKTEIAIPSTWIRPKVKLTGKNGNAFNLLALCQEAARKKKNSKEDISLFLKEAMSGNYDHLLCTCTKWFVVS
jgi:hypothetical protein